MSSKRILPIIVFSQFCCTSLWFVGNGIMEDLMSNFNLNTSALGHLTSAVQFGFILGTFLFALFTITDRFSPSRVFFFSAIIAAVFNVMMVYGGHSIISLFVVRFLTGFFLAGIYPVGMKIASDYYREGLGKSLGFLVGALVLGTAFPHFLNGLETVLPWKLVVYITFGLAVLGGVLILVFIPNGPYRKLASKLDFSVLYKVFKAPNFRGAAFGYFGHMWELYTFWAFIPVLLAAYMKVHNTMSYSVSILSFIIIGVGAFACVVSGYLSQIFGAKKIAFSALALSCLCCLLSPFFFMINNEFLFIGFLVFWGMVVIADSPLFSSLVAQNTISEYKGTALTIVNSIGFAITIVSIQVFNVLINMVNVKYLFIILAVGPFLGLIALYNKRKIKTIS
ncbi:MFS transporter [Flavivirga aquatica]|uniref:MFS transporter n=1 Tax=Flavivirga aquatica TaxID=1849968 RepID=A0A1E5SHZ2_9FLAO|nr:MFS transporter [Flavivirga aquatica]OEJ98731.1 MFS transporter [Flavivirga aquatica]